MSTFDDLIAALSAAYDLEKAARINAQHLLQDAHASARPQFEAAVLAEKNRWLTGTPFAECLEEAVLRERNACVTAVENVRLHSEDDAGHDAQKACIKAINDRSRKVAP